MAIKITVSEDRKPWFCDSKWWGSPDMPGDWDYPMLEAVEDGEAFEYPLTLLCQINCEDLENVDPQGLLPHEGMLYFFAALEEYRGFESPVHNGEGQWPKGQYLVKYSKHINMETFETNIIADEDDVPFAAEALALDFSACAEGDEGTCCLLAPSSREGVVDLLRVSSDPRTGLQLLDGGVLTFSMKESDLKYGNWKKAFVTLGKEL